MKAVSTKLGRCPAISTTRPADVLETGWTSAMDTVRKSPLRHSQPVEDITKEQGDVVELAGPDDQTCGGTQEHVH